MADPLKDLMLRPPQNPVTPTLQQLMSGVRTAGDVAHSAVVEPVQEMGRGLSDLMAGRGVTPDVGAGLMAAMGLLTPMRAGVLAPKVAQGIRAYHGSPYKFDKFSLDKIGTGEGAQAYGHGLYFAENPLTAKSYRDVLAENHGTPVEKLMAMGMVDRAGNKERTVDEAVALLRKHAENIRGYPEPTNFKPNFTAADYAEAARRLAAGERSGHMYEVNINARPEQFLDWDRPLSQQGATIQEATRPFVEDQIRRVEKLPWSPLEKNDARSALLSGDVSGAELYRANFGHGPAVPLRDAGIPGIKYLDQGSRDAGQGSSNYVVFDDSLIDILKRYGLMGGAAAPVLAGSGDQQ